MLNGKRNLFFPVIITGFFALFLIFLLFFPSAAYGEEQTDPEETVNVNKAATFEELTTWLDQNMSTGGVISLTQDITVPADASYTYVNGRYQKEITILTGGHTIYVEGYLDLWPLLTIQGDHREKEMFHILPGGELWLAGISIDAGEGNTAIVQDEGSFLVYGNIENSGMPAFSCVGNILSPETTTAAANWKYNYDTIPIVTVPVGTDFSEALLPDAVSARVNPNHGESEEEIPVVWDESAFPTEEKRTLIEGRFSEEYAQYEDYAPKCLVIWESDTAPYFLTAYLQVLSTQYTDVYLYAETPLEGEIRIEASDDGENWKEIVGTEGYESVNGTQGELLFWHLYYFQDDPTASLPKYYCLAQTTNDGTVVYSDILQLSAEYIFIGSDIEGGRGGETSPNEGENQLPSFGSGAPSDENEPELSDPEQNDDADPIWWPDHGYSEIRPQNPDPTDPSSTESDSTGPGSTDPGLVYEESFSKEDATFQNPSSSAIESDSTNGDFPVEESVSSSSTWSQSTETSSSSPEGENADDHTPDRTSSEADVSKDEVPSSHVSSDASSSLQKEETVTADVSGNERSDGEDSAHTPIAQPLQILLGIGILVLILGGSVTLAMIQKKK